MTLTRCPVFVSRLAVDVIRTQFPRRSAGSTGGHPVAYFDGPRLTRSLPSLPTASRLPTPPITSEHPMGLPHQSRNGRRHCRRAGALADFPKRRRTRWLRREHDDADLPHLSGRWRASGKGRRGDRHRTGSHATSIRGALSRAIEVVRPTRADEYRDRRVEWDALERAVLTPRTKLLAIGAASKYPRHHHRRGRRRQARARRGASASSMRCTTRARAGRPSGRSAAIAGVLAVQVLRTPSRRLRATGSAGTLDVPKVETPRHPPERLETGTSRTQAIVGAARAVDSLPRSPPLRETAADGSAGRGGVARAWTEEGNTTVGGASAPFLVDGLRAAAVAGRAHQPSRWSSPAEKSTAVGALLPNAALRGERATSMHDGRPAPRVTPTMGSSVWAARLHLRRRGRARDRGDCRGGHSVAG